MHRTADVCTSVRCCASELVGNGSGLFVDGATSGIGGGGFGLVGSTSGCMNLLFLVYLAPKLV